MMNVLLEYIIIFSYWDIITCLERGAMPPSDFRGEPAYVHAPELFLKMHSI